MTYAAALRREEAVLGNLIFCKDSVDFTDGNGSILPSARADVDEIAHRAGDPCRAKEVGPPTR